ncbi:MAG: hypothetical protein Fur0018_16080 [Anaerolineales bacterium]
MTALNLAWMLLQWPVVSAPFATAVFAYWVHRLLDEDDFFYGSPLPMLAQVWRPALQWSAWNLLGWGILLGNFWLSRGLPGEMWWALRTSWAILALFWGVINLFFWPLFFDLARPSVGLAFRRSLVFVLTRPGLCLGMGAMVLGLLIFSTALTFFLVLCWMSWTLLLAEYAVRVELARWEMNAPHTGEGR